MRAVGHARGAPTVRGMEPSARRNIATSNQSAWELFREQVARLDVSLTPSSCIDPMDGAHPRTANSTSHGRTGCHMLPRSPCPFLADRLS
jgi:hypothetical protein